MDVEVGRPQHAPQAYPQRKKHFGAAGVGDIAQVDDVAELPAKPIGQVAADFALGAAAYFFPNGSKLNFCPPTLASAIRPPLPVVKTTTPFW
jgi:hypothetical protein